MRIAKVDRNQSQIVDTLRKLGCSVFSLHTVGKGCPDLLCGLLGRNYLIEIKDGQKWKSAQKLTLAQEDFHAFWRGKIAIVRSVQDAIDFVDQCKVDIIRQNRQIETSKN